MLFGAAKKTNDLYYFVKATTGEGNVGQHFSCNTVAHIGDDGVNGVNVTSLPNKITTSMTQTKVAHRSQLDLIHVRLGHPSLSKMRHVNDEYCKGIQSIIVEFVIIQSIINFLSR